MYLTIEEYRNLSSGEISGNLSEKKLLRNISLAMLKIDELTFNRIQHIGFENLTGFQKEKIKMAVCEQTDYISENGYEETQVQSFDVLDISVTMAQDGSSQADRLHVSPVALAFLKQTGLMCRRI